MNQTRLMLLAPGEVYYQYSYGSVSSILSAHVNTIPTPFLRLEVILEEAIEFSLQVRPGMELW